MIREEMVRPRNDVDLDLHALLDRQAFDQLVDRVRRDGGVVFAMDDQAGGRAGRKKREIMGCRRRRHRDETLNFGAAHHQLHADPRPEGKACDPALVRCRVL